MITCGAVPALLSAYTGVSQTTWITIGPDFADTLGLDASRLTNLRMIGR